MDMHTTAHITQQSIDADHKAPVTEAELVTGSLAPRVSLEQIENTIASEHYFTAADGVNGSDETEVHTSELADLSLLTFCVLRLRNGFTVHGTSACADPANFDQALGRRIARQDAISKMWPLLGYELKSELAKLYAH